MEVLLLLLPQAHPIDDLGEHLEKRLAVWPQEQSYTLFLNLFVEQLDHSVESGQTVCPVLPVSPESMPVDTVAMATPCGIILRILCTCTLNTMTLSSPASQNHHSQKSPVSGPHKR